MPRFTFDMLEVPSCWDLSDVIACAFFNEVMERGLDDATFATRAVVRAWYEDERVGFNAEHIDVGGEGG